MTEVAGVVLGAIAFFVVAVAVSYNRFVRLRTLTSNSWANVDTELQRRYDLIPNLVETVQGYAAHEESVLQEVTEARARAQANHGDPASQARDETGLVQGLNHLFAVVENYPDLKASTSFLHLQEELVSTEDRIQAARRFYNANVRDLNQRVEAFPSNIIASVFSFERADYFEVEPATRVAPQVDMRQGLPATPTTSPTATNSAPATDTNVATAPQTGTDARSGTGTQE